MVQVGWRGFGADGWVDNDNFTIFQVTKMYHICELRRSQMCEGCKLLMSLGIESLWRRALPRSNCDKMQQVYLIGRYRSRLVSLQLLPFEHSEVIPLGDFWIFHREIPMWGFPSMGDNGRIPIAGWFISWEIR